MMTPHPRSAGVVRLASVAAAVRQLGAPFAAQDARLRAPFVALNARVRRPIDALQLHAARITHSPGRTTR